MSTRIRPLEEFRPDPESEFPLPFRFAPFDAGRYLATNLVGEYCLTSRDSIEALIDGTLTHDHLAHADFRRKHFLAHGLQDVALDLLATKYRTRQATLADFTALHLFVVTLRCEHSCPYCQVSRASTSAEGFDMPESVATRAVSLAFQSPSPYLKFEFQGGEPLLRFDRVRQIVLEAEARNSREERQLEFVIATNLALISDEILEFCRNHRVLISTSLDGPADLHNTNRPRPGGNSHARTIAGVARCREILGQDSVSALLTVTRRTLSQPEEVIDEYVAQGFGSIFLRWLSPHGFARKANRIGYSVHEWITFYERGLRHVLALNRRGMAIREEYAAIALRSILTPFASGYVDLRSPASLGIGSVVYNYDGRVYASDEARMLAETGDDTFCLGSVTDSYEDLFLSDRLYDVLDATMIEAVPQCSECPYAPYCGTDPVFHHATQGDLVGHRPTSDFCARNMFVFKLLIQILEDEPEHRAILESWAWG